MNTKEVFTKKRLAAVAEAYQMLQLAVSEVREAFVAAAATGGTVVYWPLFDLQLLNAVQKVAKPDDSRIHSTTRAELRSLAFLAYGETEHMENSKHLADTEEVIRLALSGVNPSDVARERRAKDVIAHKAADANHKAELEAERSVQLTEVEKDAKARSALFETRRNTNYREISKALGR